MAIHTIYPPDLTKNMKLIENQKHPVKYASFLQSSYARDGPESIPNICAQKIPILRRC